MPSILVRFSLSTLTWEHLPLASTPATDYDLFTVQLEDTFLVSSMSNFFILDTNTLTFNDTGIPIRPEMQLFSFAVVDVLPNYCL